VDTATTLGEMKIASYCYRFALRRLVADKAMLTARLRNEPAEAIGRRVARPACYSPSSPAPAPEPNGPFLGGMTRYVVEVADGQRLTVDAFGRSSASIGETVGLRFEHATEVTNWRASDAHLPD